MKTFSGDQLIKPDNLHWWPSNLTKIPNADYLERAGSENPTDPTQLPKELAAVQWPPKE